MLNRLCPPGHEVCVEVLDTGHRPNFIVKNASFKISATTEIKSLRFDDLLNHFNRHSQQRGVEWTAFVVYIGLSEMYNG